MSKLDNLVCWGSGIVTGTTTGLVFDSIARSAEKHNTLSRIALDVLVGLAATAVVTSAGYLIRNALFYEKVVGLKNYQGDIIDNGIDHTYGDFVVMQIDKRTGRIAKWHYDDGPYETVVEDKSVGGTFGGYDDITTKVIATKSGRVVSTSWTGGKVDNR